MCTPKRLPTLTAVAVTLVIAGQLAAAPVTMSPYGQAGQTRVFYGDLSGLGLMNVTGATLTDTGGLGGTNGVFSGFDCDFLVLDRDGNLATTGDQVAPLQTAATYVTPGSIRNPISSPYQKTTLHPGVLFGLNDDGSIDFATATLGSRDAHFANPLAVDTSGGWVTLGDNGSLTAAFSQTAIGDGLWLFIGEVGLSTTEAVRVSVDISGQPTVPVPGAVILASMGVVLIGGLRRRGIL
jgi:hypothetical protein